MEYIGKAKKPVRLQTLIYKQVDLVNVTSILSDQLNLVAEAEFVIIVATVVQELKQRIHGITDMVIIEKVHLQHVLK